MERKKQPSTYTRKKPEPEIYRKYSRLVLDVNALNDVAKKSSRGQTYSARKLRKALNAIKKLIAEIYDLNKKIIN